MAYTVDDARAALAPLAGRPDFDRLCADLVWANSPAQIAARGRRMTRATARRKAAESGKHVAPLPHPYLRPAR